MRLAKEEASNFLESGGDVIYWSVFSFPFSFKHKGIPIFRQVSRGLTEGRALLYLSLKIERERGSEQECKDRKRKKKGWGGRGRCGRYIVGKKMYFCRVDISCIYHMYFEKK